MSKYSQAGHGSSSTFLMRSRRGFFWTVPSAVRKAMPGITVWSSPSSSARNSATAVSSPSPSTRKSIGACSIDRSGTAVKCSPPQTIGVFGNAALQLLDQLAHDRPAVAPHAGDADRLGARRNAVR
jgi:hypothetical protein